MRARIGSSVWWAVVASALSATACGTDSPEAEKPVPCIPDCDGKECGLDGCEGQCPCPTGQFCTIEQQCLGCEQRCKEEKAECGIIPVTQLVYYYYEAWTCDCGECPAPEFCVSIAGVMNDYFSASICQTCEEVCTWNECGWIEPCDCGNCGPGEACSGKDYWHGGNRCVCAPQCSDAETGAVFECGQDGCGGECGTCEFGDCIEHTCVCTPKCGETECMYDDGCGGICDEVCGDAAYCFLGECTSPCPTEEFKFSNIVSKVVVLRFGKGGHPGEALDVDGDPDTCTPQADCEAGLDNEAASLVHQTSQFFDVDSNAAKWLEGGTVLLKEMVEPSFDGQPFTMRFYHGQIVHPKGSCDFQQEPCSYYVSTDSFNPITCQPYNEFDNAAIKDGHLTVGGKEYSINVVYTSGPGYAMEATLHQVRAEADVVTEGSNGAFALKNGVAGGAVRKQALLDAVDFISEDEAESLPVSKELLRNVLEMFLIPDIDVDGDEELDAVSFGVKFETIPATILGTTSDDSWGISFGL